MPSTPLSVPYDPDAWIHVPLDYDGTPWADAAEWAQWVAESATRGREGGAEIAEAIRAEALETARFPAAHVTARFWHYPVDGDPTGMIDLFVQQRDADGTAAADLLPEPGFTLVDPVVEPLAAPGFTSAVRRLTLNAVLPGEEAEPVLFPQAEWLGISGTWVAYAVSGDHDVAQLRARLDDGDALFAALDIASEVGDV
ncbi:hypothetical protein [Microbacterium sulfonylureivorans]|uniref:hypothetical protein n=1 Tax=Microbacterium sulfonylureivorans TaxID=2486854 RepID=UPI000FD89938|nr:hypothetical protein [Microbacterium sulfonylureivorans]